VLVPLKVRLPLTVMPLVAPEMSPDKVKVLVEKLVMTRLPLLVMNAEMVSPELLVNSRREAGALLLSSVSVPPLAAML